LAGGTQVLPPGRSAWSWRSGPRQWLDELAIFLFPVVLGIGFWLITRHQPDDDQDDDNDDMTERG